MPYNKKRRKPAAKRSAVTGRFLKKATGRKTAPKKRVVRKNAAPKKRIRRKAAPKKRVVRKNAAPKKRVRKAAPKKRTRRNPAPKRKPARRRVRKNAAPKRRKAATRNPVRRRTRKAIARKNPSRRYRRRTAKRYFKNPGLNNIAKAAVPVLAAAGGFLGARAVGNMLSRAAFMPASVAPYGDLLGNVLVVLAAHYGAPKSKMLKEHKLALTIGAGMAVVETLISRVAGPTIQGYIGAPPGLGQDFNVYAAALQGDSGYYDSDYLDYNMGEYVPEQLGEYVPVSIANDGLGEYVSVPTKNDGLGEYIAVPTKNDGLGDKTFEVEAALAGLEVEEAMAGDEDDVILSNVDDTLDDGVIGGGLYGDRDDLDEGVMEDGLYADSIEGMGIEVEEAMADWSFEGTLREAPAGSPPPVTRGNVIATTKRVIHQQIAHGKQPTDSVTQSVVRKIFGIGPGGKKEPQNLAQSISAIGKATVAAAKAQQAPAPKMTQKIGPAKKWSVPEGKAGWSTGIFKGKTP